jgi:hypothetical protein
MGAKMSHELTAGDKLLIQLGEPMPGKLHCPLLRQANQVQRSGEQMLRGLRRLRLGLRHCQTCQQHGDCAIHSEFNQQVDSLIAEISREWDLTS